LHVDEEAALMQLEFESTLTTAPTPPPPAPALPSWTSLPLGLWEAAFRCGVLTPVGIPRGGTRDLCISSIYPCHLTPSFRRSSPSPESTCPRCRTHVLPRRKRRALMPTPSLLRPATVATSRLH
jgi:hypothetical protein